MAWKSNSQPACREAAALTSVYSKSFYFIDAVFILLPAGRAPQQVAGSRWEVGGVRLRSLLCAEGAGSPGRILTARAGGAQRREDLGWGPSCCERSPGRAQDWGPAWLQGRGLGQVRALDEGCLP